MLIPTILTLVPSRCTLRATFISPYTVEIVETSTPNTFFFPDKLKSALKLGQVSRLFWKYPDNLCSQLNTAVEQKNTVELALLYLGSNIADKSFKKSS